MEGSTGKSPGSALSSLAPRTSYRRADAIRGESGRCGEGVPDRRPDESEQEGGGGGRCGGDG